MATVVGEAAVDSVAPGQGFQKYQAAPATAKTSVTPVVAISIANNTTGANVDARRDVVIADGPVDELDHAAPFTGAGSKMGIDATAKIAGEGVVRPWPQEIRMTDDVRRRIDQRWRELGLD